MGHQFNDTTRERGETLDGLQAVEEHHGEALQRPAVEAPLTANQARKRLDTLFAVKEWSDRDPDVEWYQLGGLHFKPLTGEAHQAKVQVDHAVQQRWYSAVRALLDAERGYTEAVATILDLAWVGEWLKRHEPEVFMRAAQAHYERKQRAARAA